MSLRNLPRPFHILLVGTFINRVGGFVVPFLSLYLVKSRDLSPTEAGMVVSFYGIGGMGAGLLGGTVADRIGRKPALLMGLWGGAVAMAVLGTLSDPLSLAIGCFFLGLIGESYRPAVFATVADLLAPEQRLHAYAYLYQAVNLGFAVALPVAGLLFSFHSSLMFAGDALTSALCGVVVALGIPETRGQKNTPLSSTPDPGLGALLRDPHLIVLLLLTLPLALALWQNGVTLPLRLSTLNYSPDVYGWLISINGIMIVVLQPWITSLLLRLSRPVAYWLSSFLYALGIGLQAYSFSVPAFAGTVVLWTLGEMSNTPINSSTLSDLAPAALRARYQGAFNTTWGLAAAGGPAFAGWLWEHYGAQPLWLGMGGACLAVAFLHLWAGPLREQAILARR